MHYLGFTISLTEWNELKDIFSEMKMHIPFMDICIFCTEFILMWIVSYLILKLFVVLCYKCKSKQYYILSILSFLAFIVSTILITLVEFSWFSSIAENDFYNMFMSFIMTGILTKCSSLYTLPPKPIKVVHEVSQKALEGYTLVMPRSDFNDLLFRENAKRLEYYESDSISNEYLEG